MDPSATDGARAIDGAGEAALLRKYSEVFRTLCALADLAVVSAAFVGAYLLRCDTPLLPESTTVRRCGSASLPMARPAAPTR